MEDLVNLLYHYNLKENTSMFISVMDDGSCSLNEIGDYPFKEFENEKELKDFLSND